MAILKTVGAKGSAFPEFGVKEVSLFPVGEQLKVKLIIVFKERAKKYASWYTKAAKNNFFLKVIQVTDKDIAAKYLSEGSVLTKINMKSKNTKHVKEQLINVQAALKEQGLKFTMGGLRKFYVGKDIGGDLFEIPIELEFMIDIGEPQHLQYILCPKIAGADGALVKKPQKLNGQIKVEKVIEGGALVKTSNVRLVEVKGNNLVGYTGPVNYMARSTQNMMTETEQKT